MEALWGKSVVLFSGDQFSKSDLNRFLSCVYDVKTCGGKKSFTRISRLKIFLWKVKRFIYLFFSTNQKSVEKAT